MRASWAASVFAVVILQLLETDHCQAYISGPSVKPRRHARGLGLSSKTLRVGEKRAGHQSVIGVTRFKGTRRLRLTSAEYCDEGEFEERMQLLTRVLEQDLPLQYEKPQDLSCFSGGIEFDDPVTSLRGKLLYRGMLFFTMLFFRVACQPGSYFTVTSIDRPARQTIRTIWETGAVTRWNGRDVFISGVDTFSGWQWISTVRVSDRLSLAYHKTSTEYTCLRKALFQYRNEIRGVSEQEDPGGGEV